MATFVLVHGGGHGGWCYQKVARILQGQGHIVYAPSLEGMGEHAHMVHPGVDMNAQIDGVVGLLHMEDLHGVILVGHSYGGMVITGVADRAPGRVGHRVYLDAAYPLGGQSLTDHAGSSILAARGGARMVDGVEMVLFAGTDPLGFYGVTDPDDIAWMKERLTPHPWKCFDQKLVFQDEAAMRAIPESHIVCTVTKAGRDMDLLMQRAQGRVWDIDTGHDLMITEPEWVAARLGDVAASMG